MNPVACALHAWWTVWSSRQLLCGYIPPPTRLPRLSNARTATYAFRRRLTVFRRRGERRLGGRIRSQRSWNQVGITLARPIGRIDSLRLMGQLIRVNTPRTPELVEALAQAGIATRGSVVGEPATRDLPEESFIAELEASNELEAVGQLRQVLGDEGQIGVEPLGPPGDLPSPSTLRERLDT